jgi:hypothetical protein
MANAFNPTLRKNPFFIDCYKKDNNYYYKVSYPIIEDSLADKIITKVENKDKSEKIPISLNDINAKYYIYLECQVSQNNFQLTSYKIKGSEKILPYIDGSDNSEGFDQTHCRAMLGIIGFEGSVCQNVTVCLMSRLAILNGSPVVNLSSNTDGLFCYY